MLQRTILTLLVLVSFSARADILDAFELFPTFDLPQTWEASTPPAAEMKDQKRFPYCGLFAMATFLEIWGDTTRAHVFPPIDESYLSLGYNRVVGSPKMGTSLTWLSLTTQIFGALPKGAKFRGTGSAWPIENWRQENTRLISTKITDPLLTGKYVWGRNTQEFTGPQFLSDYLHIDMRNFYVLHTDFEEGVKGDTSPNEEQAVAAPLRLGSLEATAKSMQAIALKMGGDTRMAVTKPEVLYKATKLQLYARRPVYMGINAGLTKDKFRKYGVLTSADLVPVGTGFNGAHAVVAVAHCDKTNSVDRICQRFGPYMKQRNVDECIAVQNSWGTAVNDKGFFCLAPDAWRRVTQAVFIEKNLVKGN